MIALEPHPLGVILPVRAQPGSRKNELKGEQGGALKVAVTQVAEKGKANKAVIDLLCVSLDLRKSQLELLSGETSPQKKFLVRDITLDELALRLKKLQGEPPRHQGHQGKTEEGKTQRHKDTKEERE